MKQGVITSARLAAEQFGDDVHASFFLTLTYRPGVAWAPDHISLFVRKLRQWAERSLGRDFAYVWKLELTKAGNPHYHVVCWVSGVVFMPKLDDEGFWPHGMTRVERARNPVGYMAKYLGKEEIGVLPPGARLWGFGGLTGERRGELRWWRAPRWLRKFVPVEHGLRRLKRGWWQDLTTNYSYRSPYEWDWITERFVFVGWQRERFDMSGLVARLKGMLTTEEEWSACYGSW